MRRSLVPIFCASLCAVALAQSPEKIAEEHFNKGNTAYNLGRWSEAVESFTNAYEAWPQPEFLYNIAQAHRQAGDCKKALHFYKRFRSLKENDRAAPLSKKKRDEVDKFIVQLTECVAKTDTTTSTPPDTLDSPPPSEPAPAQTPPAPAETPVPAPPAVVPVQPELAATRAVEPRSPLIAVRLGAAVTKLVLGPGVAAPVQPSLWLAGGYPLRAGPVTIELGAGLSWTPLPYDDMSGASRIASLTSILANTAASYPILRKLAVRAEVGAGASVLGGVSAMGNPFTRGGAPASGALGMLGVRVGASLDYEVARNVIATVTPIAFSFSPPNAALREDIRLVGRVEVVFGIGYRR
jgi:hypothetical protein